MCMHIKTRGTGRSLTLHTSDPTGVETTAYACYISAVLQLYYTCSSAWKCLMSNLPSLAQLRSTYTESLQGILRTTPVACVRRWDDVCMSVVGTYIVV